jgi:hypothetical protein
MRTTKHPMKRLALTTALLLLGAGAALADVPGYEFMMFPEGMAMVVDQTGKASKAKISEDTARTLTADAQRFSNSGILLVYHGQLYFVPDKQLGNGQMMSTMVLPSGSDANK